MIRKCSVAQDNQIYCNATFFQEVLSRCFELELSRIDSPDCYFNSLFEELKPKRDMLAKFLIEAGLEPVVPEAGYFMLVNIANLAKDFQGDASECKNVRFAKYLCREKVN